MVYDTLSDMIIDNRNSLVKEIKHLSAEDKENVLAAFDWLAVGHIKEYIANGMIIEKLKERYTEDEVRSVDAEVARNFRLLLVAEQKYYNDVEACRKIGYSAEEKAISGECCDNVTMTLEEAIKHCKEKEDCSACGEEHRQLRRWLENYRFLCNLGTDAGRIKKLLSYEYECVSRQSGILQCDRNCAECDIVQDDKELLQMYKKVMSVLSYLEQAHNDNTKLLSDDSAV